MGDAIKQRYYKYIFLCLISFVNCQNDNHELKINANYRSSELLLSWFRKPGDDRLIDSLLLEPGSQIMAENVKLLREDSQDTLAGFEIELRQFDPRDTLRKYPFGTNLAWNYKEKSLLLLKKIQREKIENELINRALAFIPNDYPIKTACNIYFVLTGWEWGDAYVVNVKQAEGRYRITEEEEGIPTIVINLSLIAKLYGDTVEDHFRVLSGLLSHEIFHFAFTNYKNQSAIYQAKYDTSKINSLVNVIHNEGIAHYIDKRSVLIGDYDTVFMLKEKERLSIEKLTEAFVQMTGPAFSLAQKRELLKKASTGKYWSKYGSIAGMFIAYHIEKERGSMALMESIRLGPINFLHQYIDIQRVNEHLPPLGSELKAFVLSQLSIK